MTDDQIIDIFRSHDDGDDAGAVAVGRAIEKVAEADAIERCAKRVERAPLDLFGMPAEMRITARAHVADDLRALLPKEES